MLDESGSLFSIVRSTVAVPSGLVLEYFGFETELQTNKNTIHEVILYKERLRRPRRYEFSGGTAKVHRNRAIVDNWLIALHQAVASRNYFLHFLSQCSSPERRLVEVVCSCSIYETEAYEIIANSSALWEATAFRWMGWSCDRGCFWQLHKVSQVALIEDLGFLFCSSS